MDNKTLHEQHDSELYHYGVKGMRWGIRRGKRDLAEYHKTGDKQAHNRGVATLSSHRDKATKKIAKLDKKYEKLQNKRDRQIVKGDVKAAKLDRKAARKRKKAYGAFTSTKRAIRLISEANALEIRSNRIKSLSKETQAKINANRKYRELFDRGISEINNELVTKGEDYVFFR